ncbi:signal recognition particle receptor subunit alpha isoform X2 [Selaginella moellendorffii]|uniref:signal recognition particle receptor subunit alpha isoform X2 n=1 Tax=Selaginella moellendorffii TaxID=88036 RepID=UPI000D1C693A|nr:signal recognition particle receptor subunit alpha isoform X2 [Selaginella moellendorffii]|eukprot:XP_024531204.1 signal recognition particle receptor subunit alpha isoform X2 [Selaginella moellendorffii]
MLEQLLIFTRGGLILWSCKEIGNALKGSPIDTLIRSCLLEERSGDRSFRYDAPGASYTLKWTFQNELGLVFVAVYQQFLQLLYVDELLAMVKREFSAVYSPRKASYRDFDEVYRQLEKEALARGEANKGLNKANRKIEDGSSKNTDLRGGTVLRGSVKGSAGTKGQKDGKEDDSAADHKPAAVVEKAGHENGVTNGKLSSSDEESKPVEVAFDRSKLQKLKAKGGKKTNAAKKEKEDPKKKVKQDRKPWDAPATGKLDYSEPVRDTNDEEVVEVHGKSLVDYEEDEESDDEEAKDEKAPAKKGWFSSVFQSVTGKAALEKADLVPAMKALKDRLMTKNVAEEIAEKICESVAASLLGKKLGTFTRVSSAVKEAMGDALLRILTPKRSIDILRDVKSAKDEGRPYVIVFVGVNGVGKSTSLAKVAYWLKSHELSVLIAACDTFRSGAVEQLRTHAKRLQTTLYEKGYEKDPANVAREAIATAAKTKHDVVLVDTAGRMQDNEPLMRALANLINVNKPDLVLFVGEALVGNEAVDQLSKFNQTLADLSATAKRKPIDGILLTKFDTIDDKVGAALSMVYVSGAPIMFLGCGQSYHDLRRLNVKSIIKTLLQ